MTESRAVPPEKALRLRKRVKGRKPSFVRAESWRYVRIKESWRRPKGLDHKMRIKYKGWPPAASVGYRGPKISRGFHPSGFQEILVHNAEDLKKVDPKTHVVRIAHTVGKRKRARIMTDAKKRKLIILNVKEIKEAAEKERELPKEKQEEPETKEETTAKESAEPEPDEKQEKPKRRKRRTQKQ